MSLRAIVAVLVRGRGDERETRGQDVLVTVNGYPLPVRSLSLRVEGRQAIATMEIVVDEVQISDMPATIAGLAKSR